MLLALLSKANRLLGTGNNRFELERLYLEHADPWEYFSSSYERQKYERTLACVLKWRGARENVLELACSIGAFSGMLADHFDNVTAIDLSREALRRAIDNNRGKKNIRFVQGDLRSFELCRRYDVIVCAEVLYYVMEKDARSVCRRLDEHLAPHGTIFVTYGIPSGNEDSYCDNWEQVLGARFKRVFKEGVQDAARPYQITVFTRRH
jgi:cyclopropane fatty-acyl-phospholipid synthase-like methyltransferase